MPVEEAGLTRYSDRVSQKDCFGVLEEVIAVKQ